jgi:hypothetical protein
MDLILNKSRPRLKALLKKLGLQEAVGRLWRLVQLFGNPNFRRRERVQRQRFLQFKQNYADVLKHRLISNSQAQKSALIIGMDFPEIEAELGLIKGAELAGFSPKIVLPHQFPLALDYYRLASIKYVRFLSEFTPSDDLAAAEAAIENCQSSQELLEFKYMDVGVGRIAVATALRQHRMASFDLKLPRDRRRIVEYVASSISATKAAQTVLQNSRPEVALMWDPVYTPQGELFDSCLGKGIDVIGWSPAHRSNTLMLKRYSRENRDQQISSLSSESWKMLLDMEWTESRQVRLQHEFYDSYTSGDWYSSAGTQYNKLFVDANGIQKQLGLDPAKKTAIIFPHIFWDASLTSGKDLFRSYEEWFIETVRSACLNVQVNWVIKIHPAHVGKALMEGYRGEPAEVSVLRKNVGKLPPHIFMIPADSNISTFSLFALMDYCITVRGTPGIEAARLGIPVLTAGTGRYDRRGFTLDSDSREDYAEKLNRIQEISRLTPAQRELAERFAYGLFVLRPLPLTSVPFGYHKDFGAENYFNKTQINIRNEADWYKAPDISAFARWLAESTSQDYLMPIKDD